MKKNLGLVEGERQTTLAWATEYEFAPPKKVIPVDDTFKADTFLALASQDEGFLWQGDFHNAKQLLQAVQRRMEKRAKPLPDTLPPAERFHRHRQAQGHKARTLSRLFVPVSADLSIPLGRAPEVREAIAELAEGVVGDFVVSLRELLGLIGANEWRKKGVRIAALDGVIHPRYGVYSPVRGEYLDLVAQAPLPETAEVAFDIGTGTGVIAAILAKRGVPRILATDLDPRAIACARENIERLGFAASVEIVQTSFFPEGKADLVVCNPPWLPVKPTTAIERALYDEASGMLKGFLNGVAAHLNPGGEAWLILSDLAEHLGLRPQGELETLIASAGLEVAGLHETRPRHGKATDEDDPLFAARSKEVTRLWRLRPISR